MPERDVSLTLKFVNQMSGPLGAASRAIHNFASQTSGSFKSAKNSANSFLKTISSPQALMGGLLGAGAGMMIMNAAKKVIELDSAMTDLRINGRLTAAETMRLKDEILDTGIRSGATTESLLELSKAALHGSNNVKFVREELGFMTSMMQATGASGGELGESLGEIYKKSGLTGKAFEELIAKMYSVGKKTGRESTFKDILPNVPRLLTTIKAINPKATLSQIGDYLAASMFIPNPAALDKAMRFMTRSTKAQAIIRKMGIDTSQGVPKIADVMGKIMGSTSNVNERLLLMGQIFGRGAMDMKVLADHWDQYSNAVTSSNVNDYLTDASVKSHDMASAMHRLEAISTKLADSALAPALDEISKSLANIKPEDMKLLVQTFTEMGKELGVVVGWSIKLIELFGKIAMGYEIVGEKIHHGLMKKGIGEKMAEQEGARLSMVAAGGQPVWDVTHNVYIDGSKIPHDKAETNARKTGRQGKVGK